MRTFIFELIIALRYTKAKSSNGFISLISMVSIIGIALGVTALITVLSVMNGFENELRSRILGMASHATINSYDGQIPQWKKTVNRAESHNNVIAAAPFVEGQGLINADVASSGTLVRGIDPAHEENVSEIGDKMREGQLASLTSGDFNAVIGSELAAILGVGVGDKITLIIPKSNITVLGARPRMKRFTVSGIFEVGMYEYDRALMLINLEDAKVLYRLEKGVSGIRLKLDDIFKAAKISSEVAATLGQDLYTKDWTARHANFFRAIKTEKTVMFIILSLIIAVAAVNIISTMVMVVTDKRSEIAILRTIGATATNIRNIFLIQGVIIGFLGTLTGVVCGVALAENLEVIIAALERTLEVQFMPSDVYYINEVPSKLEYPDVYKVTAVSFLLTVAATWFPARRAAKTNPAEALRYE